MHALLGSMKTDDPKVELNKDRLPDSSHVPAAAQLKQKHKVQPYILFPGLLMLGITLGHYLVPADSHVIHNLLQRLYYIPIIWPAYRYGVKGGVLAAGIALVAYLPHIFLTWHSRPEYQVSQIIETLLFMVVGYCAGYLFEQRLRSQMILRSYERMANFGNLSRSIIRSLKGPLRAIRGMLVALEPIEKSNEAMRSCTDVIRDEIRRIEVVRSDLIELVQRKRLRLKSRNLNDVMFQFASQIEPSLRVKGISLARKSAKISVSAQINKKAITEVLHELTGMLLPGTGSDCPITLYTGEASQYSWIGASFGNITLNAKYTGDLIALGQRSHKVYDLVRTLNVMNDHFGDVACRWKNGSLVEFILVFPKNLKLPWYLKDKAALELYGHQAG